MIGLAFQRRAGQLLLGLFVATLVPRGALGQAGIDASIVGYVSDLSGNPIPGATIVAASTAGMGGDREATSNDRGGFWLPQLSPGTLRVTASAPGYGTVVYEPVLVGSGAPAQVNIVLRAASGYQAAQVLPSTPTVGTTTSHVQEAYDLALLEAMPLPSRYNVLAQMVGQVGGTLGYRIRGGESNQTIVTQDGFDTRGRFPVSTAVAAYEVHSAGYGADNATAPGGLVGVVTRTGSNRWDVEVAATAENETLRLGEEGAWSGTYYYRINPAAAGPLIRDKLWFALAVESHLSGQGGVADPEGIVSPGVPPHLRLISLGTLRITWRVAGGHRLSFLSNVESGFGSNLKRDIGVAEEAQQNWREGPSGLWGVIWEALLTDRLALRSQVGYIQRPQYWYPRLCDDGACDATPAVIQRFPRRIELNNAAYGCPGAATCLEGRDLPHRREDLYALQAFNRLEYVLDNPILGEHRLQLKHQIYTEKEIHRKALAGAHLEERNGTVPEARTTYYANDPRFDLGRPGWWIGTGVLYRSSASVGDTWRPTRHLTFTATLSHIWVRGDNGAGDAVVNHTSWTPSLAAVWDPTHDGRTALRSSYSQYVDIDVRGPVQHTIGEPASQRCLWNTDTGAYDRDCAFGGGQGNTIGLPCSPTGLDADGRSCRHRLTVPRTHEYTLGAEREILPGLGLSLDLIYRRFGNQYQVRETNRIWNGSGTAVTGYRTGRPETVVDLDTSDSVRRTYRGVTLTLDNRRGRLRSIVSYTLSDLRGTTFASAVDPFGPAAVYIDGPEPDDRRHAVKAAAAWPVGRRLSLGLRYQYGSGLPVHPIYRNPVNGIYEIYRPIRGVNPGTMSTRTAPELRTPAVQALDVQVRLVLAAAAHRFDLYAEALGVLDSARATDDGSSFGSETAGVPLRLRLGMSYRF
jgi:hypothetical protein